jgi:CRISPR-associated protein Cas1
MRVKNARLFVKDGKEFERAEPASYELKPKYDEHDNIVIYGHSGNITLEAINWLSRQNIQLTVLNWDGCLLTNIVIPEPKAGGVRLAQYQAYSHKIGVGHSPFSPMLTRYGFTLRSSLIRRVRSHTG